MGPRWLECDINDNWLWDIIPRCQHCLKTRKHWQVPLSKWAVLETCFPVWCYFKLTRVDGFLHVHSTIWIQLFFLRGQTRIKLKVGEANPQERWHDCRFCLRKYPINLRQTSQWCPADQIFQIASVSLSATSPQLQHTQNGPGSSTGEKCWLGRMR